MRYYPTNNSYRGSTSISGSGRFSASSDGGGGNADDTKSFASASYHMDKTGHVDNTGRSNRSSEYTAGGSASASAHTASVSASAPSNPSPPQETSFEPLNDVSRENIVVEVGNINRQGHSGGEDEDDYLIVDDDDDYNQHGGHDDSYDIVDSYSDDDADNDEDEMRVRTLHPKRMAQALHQIIDVSHSEVDPLQPASTLSLTSSGYNKRQNAIRRVLRQLPEKYSCLDVGAGKGRFLTKDWPYEKDSTEQQHHHYNHYPSEYVALERDPAFNKPIRRAMVSRGGAIKGRIIISRKQPSQIKSLKGKQFDLIVIQHPAYFGFLTSPDINAAEGYSIDPIKVVADTIHQFLKPDTGICLVFHYGFGTFDAVYHMFNKDFVRYGKCRYPLLTHLELNMMKVVGGLKSYLSTDNKDHRILVEMDQSYCIPLDELSSEQRHVLISYATQTDSKTLSSSTRKEVWNMIVGSCRQHSKNDDRLLLNHPHITITIQSENILEDEEYYEEYFDDEEEMEEIEETYHPEEEDEIHGDEYDYHHEGMDESEYEIEVLEGDHDHDHN